MKARKLEPPAPAPKSKPIDGGWALELAFAFKLLAMHHESLASLLADIAERSRAANPPVPVKELGMARLRDTEYTGRLPSPHGAFAETVLTRWAETPEIVRLRKVAHEIHGALQTSLENLRPFLTKAAAYFTSTVKSPAWLHQVWTELYLAENDVALVGHVIDMRAVGFADLCDHLRRRESDLDRRRAECWALLPLLAAADVEVLPPRGRELLERLRGRCLTQRELSKEMDTSEQAIGTLVAMVRRTLGSEIIKTKRRGGYWIPAAPPKE